MKKELACIALFAILSIPSNYIHAQSLETGFEHPSITYRPYAWWHWMGPNFSMEGITKDLEAMKEAGIGGATIFNVSSAVQESSAPTENNPWKEQTYRSSAYWKALQFACSEAERLGMELGLHNTVGYSTTGGPWIQEDQGMKHLVWRKEKITGGKKITTVLPPPDLPPYKGWGAFGKTVPDKYDEISVVAIPCGNSYSNRDTYDLKKYLDKDNRLTWKAPKGNWTIFRIGYASTMSCPHPVPDELIGKVLEVNKIDSAYTRYHWENVLNPLKEHIGKYFGKSFKHVLIDSYEAGEQNWSRNFRQDFIQMKGYDPVPWLPYALANQTDTLSVLPNLVIRFKWDLQDVISRLYQQYGWQIAKDKLSALGLALQQEPYWGPFSTIAGAASADIPMGEFWTSSSGMIQKGVTAGGRAAGHTVIGAEAYTSAPDRSRWTEDPAMLKKTTEGAFASGVNRLILHQWVHQAFDDRYQPGMSMGWWGTHFSRFQPWIKPGKAYFEYLGRCQYLLQQGEQVIDFLTLDEAPDHDTDAIVTTDFLNKSIDVQQGKIILYSGRRYRIMQFPHMKVMQPEVLYKLGQLVKEGATVIAEKPDSSPSLKNYPQCDDSVRIISDRIWKQYAGTRIFSSKEAAIKAIGLAPDYKTEVGQASVVHRHSHDGDIYYVGNLSDKEQDIRVSLRIDHQLPEIWNAETGKIKNAEDWKFENGRTLVSIHLQPYQSRFIVMRRVATLQEIEQGKSAKPILKRQSILPLQARWTIHFEPKLDTPFTITADSLTDFSLSTDKRIKYFTGTTTYQTEITIPAQKLSGAPQVWLDLGEMNDIAEVSVNHMPADTLWYPPYRADISQYLQKGKNAIRITVTNNWANRMIGDEQYPADFEWGTDRGEKLGRAMKAYPEWFLKGEPRPQKDRKCFEVWYYYRKDSPLQKAGLDGPVNIEFWK